MERLNDRSLLESFEYCLLRVFISVILQIKLSEISFSVCCATSCKDKVKIKSEEISALLLLLYILYL